MRHDLFLVFAITLCLAARAFPAHAAEEDAALIDFWSASHAQAEIAHEQWKPRPQNALEVLQKELASEKEEKKVKKSDKVLVIAFGAVLAAGLVASVVSYRENARGGDGSLCCRSEPYIPGRKPLTVGDPDEND